MTEPEWETTAESMAFGIHPIMFIPICKMKKTISVTQTSETHRLIETVLHSLISVQTGRLSGTVVL